MNRISLRTLAWSRSSWSAVVVARSLPAPLGLSCMGAMPPVPCPRLLLQRGGAFHWIYKGIESCTGAQVLRGKRPFRGRDLKRFTVYAALERTAGSIRRSHTRAAREEWPHPGSGCPGRRDHRRSPLRHRARLRKSEMGNGRADRQRSGCFADGCGASHRKAQALMAGAIGPAL